MTKFARLAWMAALGAALVACTSGSNAPTCSFKDPATLPTPGGTPGVSGPSAWSKFRYDIRNTGTIVDSDVYSRLASNPHATHWRFEVEPPPSPAPSPLPSPPPFSASPVLNAGEDFLYIGSTNGRLYKLSTIDGTQPPPSDPEHFEFVVPGPGQITSTALIASRDLHDAIFVGGNNGGLYALNYTGAAQASFWPFFYNSSISVSPTLSSDGAVYVGSVDGLFEGICPNGIFRFALSNAGVRSSAAIGADNSVYYGADDGQLRALQGTGVFEWAFATAGAIVTAPVVEVSGSTTTAIYVADRGGRVFKVSSSGRPVPGFIFNRGPNDVGQAVGAIASSPALAGDRLYFGSDDGNLYAVDSANGSIVWSCTGLQCRAGVPMAQDTGPAISSSPAVAMDGDNRVIVVGSDDGNVYFVADDGTNLPTPTAFSIGAPVRSSPAIGADGTVYVGADDSRVYAIGTPS